MGPNIVNQNKMEMKFVNDNVHDVYDNISKRAY